MYDKKRRGFFDFEDYRLVGEGISKYLTEDDLRSAFKAIDFKGNGRITLDIFKRVMKGLG